MSYLREELFKAWSDREKADRAYKKAFSESVFTTDEIVKAALAAGKEIE